MSTQEARGRGPVPGAARVPATIARVVCAQLEQVGVVANVKRRWEAAASTAEILEQTEDLAARFEVQRIEDARRLRSIDEYAESEGCRSAFIRRHFGEDDPPDCGRCDNCQRAKREAKRRRR